MIEIRGCDSVIFETRQLTMIRTFYMDVLGLTIPTFEKDGRHVPDENENYVNFECGNLLLGFERGSEVQKGTLVLLVGNLEKTLAKLAEKGAKPVRQNPKWAILLDPEGREIILQVAEPG